MPTVGARELKNRLGRYLRQVRMGETILITDRGRPVAELRPLSAAAVQLDERLQELATAGLIRLPTRAGSGRIPRLRIDGGALSPTVSEDREDRL